MVRRRDIIVPRVLGPRVPVGRPSHEVALMDALEHLESVSGASSIERFEFRRMGQVTLRSGRVFYIVLESVH